MEKRITLISAFVLFYTSLTLAQAPIIPKVTDNTIFVAVKEYVEIDPVVNNGMIKISNSGILSYVDINGKTIFGEAPRLTAGGSSYDKSRGWFSGGSAMVARGSYPNLVQNTILFYDQKYFDLPATYQKVTGFCEGIAMAEKPSGSNKACCYINQMGQEVFPSLSFPYSYYSGNFKVSPLREGLRAFLEPSQGLWGYADENGKVIIKPQFSKALPFSEGLAAVAIKENYSDKWGFIDKTGKIIIPAVLKNFPSSFSEGLAVVKTESGKMVYIDKTGKTVSPEFYQCNVFHGGYAFINTDYCKTAVIDKSFQIVKIMGEKEQFEIQGDNAENILEMPFYDGVLAVKTCFGAGGLILNSKGDVLIKGTDSDVFDNFYSCGLALAKLRIGDKWFSGFINKRGELQIVFVPEGTILSQPVFPKSYIAKFEEPNPPTAGKGTLAAPCGKQSNDAAIPVSKECRLTLVVRPAEAGTATTAGSYLEGTSILLTATGTFPNKYRYTFSHWENESKDTLSRQQSFYFTMPPKDTELTAVFNENPKRKLTIAGDECGTVSGGGEFYVKEPFTIKAQVKEGNKFDGWYKGERLFSSQATLTQAMPDEDLHLIAKLCGKKPGSGYVPFVPQYPPPGTGGGNPPPPKFPCTNEGCNVICAYAGNYEFTLSSQSIAGFTNDAAPVKIPAMAYMEMHPCGDMPTAFAGNVTGVLYFDFDPVKTPDDMKKLKKYMESNEAMGDYLFLYYSPLYIYRITGQHIYAMGSGFMGVDKAPNEFWTPGRIYRFEYTISADNAVVLGKHQIYNNRIVRINGVPKNRYEWINPGLVRGTDLVGAVIDIAKPLLPDNIRSITGTEDYIYEPEKENRYKGCTLKPVVNTMQYIPWIAKPNMLELLDKSLKHPKAVSIGVDNWYDMMMMIIQDNYEKLYRDLQNYDQPDAVTDNPLPTFDS